MSMRNLIPFIALLVFTSCAPTNPLVFETEGIRYEVSKHTFRVGETITGRFVNGSGQRVFHVSMSGCLLVLHKWNGERWMPLIRPDVGCTAVVSFWPSEPGEVIELAYDPDWLDLVADDPVGLYRFSSLISPEDGNYQMAEPISSETFRVTE